MYNERRVRPHVASVVVLMMRAQIARLCSGLAVARFVRIRRYQRNTGSVMRLTLCLGVVGPGRVLLRLRRRRC